MDVLITAHVPAGAEATFIMDVLERMFEAWRERHPEHEPKQRVRVANCEHRPPCTEVRLSGQIPTPELRRRDA